MSEPIRFDFAVNDDSGNLSGYITDAHLRIGPSCAAELTAGIWPPSACPAFSQVGAFPPKAIKIARRQFAISGYSAWSGNMAWDSARVTPMVAVEILNYLRELGWHNEGGISAIGEIWESGRSFRPSDIAALAMTDEELAERKRERAKQWIPGGVFVRAEVGSGS